MIEINGIAWFRAKDCATIMDYKDQKKAIKAHVDADWQRTLRELREIGGVGRPPGESASLNDLNAKWISEAGLYELASSSKLPLARTFKKWVFGEVLPSIRKTGAYTAVQPAATKDDAVWHSKRIEGKELMKSKNATLQELVASFGQAGRQLYSIVATHINQAVLGFDEETKAFKARH